MRDLRPDDLFILNGGIIDNEQAFLVYKASSNPTMPENLATIECETIGTIFEATRPEDSYEH